MEQKRDAEGLVEKFDDYSLSRVPDTERKHWFGIATMRFGQISALSQFLLGAALGFGMTFWTAFWALTLGAVILEVVSIFVGIAGMREGLNVTLLARWTGFGKFGTAILSFAIAASMMGWFGIQNAVFAEGIQELLGGPFWAWAIATGVLVTVIVIFGILSLGFTAYVAVPLFMVVVFYSFGATLSDHSLGSLIGSAAPGPTMSLAAGASIVAGGFIAGAIITPDMSRYNRSAADVVKQTVVGITLGEYLIGLIGVLLAHAAQTDNIISIVMSTSGVIGTVVLITATVKINDWNLYSSSLGVVNFIDMIFNRQINRTIITIIVGLFATLLSIVGILDYFESYLSLLGVALPPAGAIIAVEYFLVRRSRSQLDSSRTKGELPSTYDAWNPVTLIAWVAGFLVGEFVNWGIPSVNSLLSAAVLYWVLSIIVKSIGNINYGTVKTYSSSEETS